MDRVVQVRDRVEAWIAVHPRMVWVLVLAAVVGSWVF